MANFLPILSGGLTFLVIALFLTICNLADPFMTPRRQQVLRAALFILAALATMRFPVYVHGDVLLDQRAAILAMAAVFGGGTTTLATAAVMLVYRAYIGGSAVLAGMLGIVINLAACTTLVYWWRQRYGDTERRSRLILAAAVTSGVCSWLALLMVPPFEEVGHLLRQNGLALFLVQIVSACVFGFLLKLHAERQHSVNELRQKNIALRDSLEQTIGALSTAMMHRDPGVASHEKRVVELAVAIGAEMGMTGDRLEGVKLAALVHDIGKLQLPAEILMRPRKLSEEEFALVKLHPENGYHILKDIQFPWPLAEIVRQHHENVDGSGYPHGMAGEQILLEARILRVADSMEAMLSHRPFRRAYDLDYAIASLEVNKGKYYDPQIADACIRVFRDKDFSFMPFKKAA